MKLQNQQSINTPYEELRNYLKDTNKQKNIAIFLHLSSLVFVFIIPLIIWIFSKEKKSFIYNEAIKALNYNITLILMGFANLVLGSLPIGIQLDIPLCILAISLILKVSYEISHDEESDYKLTYQFIK